MMDTATASSPEACKKPGFAWPIVGLVASAYGGGGAGMGLILSTITEEKGTRPFRVRTGFGGALFVTGLVGIGLSS